MLLVFVLLAKLITHEQMTSVHLNRSQKSFSALFADTVKIDFQYAYQSHPTYSPLQEPNKGVRGSIGHFTLTTGLDFSGFVLHSKKKKESVLATNLMSSCYSSCGISCYILLLNKTWCRKREGTFILYGKGLISHKFFASVLLHYCIKCLPQVWIK